MITNSPATWPTGDKVWDICRAIAHAEGAFEAGSVPDRLNNPGDISDWKKMYGFEHHSGSDVTTFPDKETGWNKLYDKINTIALGRSHVFSPSMSWTTIAKIYAGDWQNWLNNVTHYLGVTPESTFNDYVKG